MGRATIRKSVWRFQLCDTTKSTGARSYDRPAGAGLALASDGLVGQIARAADAAPTVKITEPFYGAVLNHRHGKQTSRGLAIRVAGEAPSADRVTVNGAPCRARVAASTPW